MEEICRLGKESLKEIVAFDCLCFPTDFWQQEDWENLLKDERAIYYALLDGEQIVAGLFLYNWQGKRDYVKIMSLAVHPKYRQAGLGRAAAASRRAGDEAAWDDKVLRRNQSVQPCHAAVVYKVWLSAGVGRGKLLPASRRKCIQVYPAIK